MIIFTIIGVIVVAGFVLACLAVIYSQFVHPLFQAISLSNWYLACVEADAEVSMVKLPYWRLIRHYYEVGGWPGERTWNSVGEWYGIGRWRVFPIEDEAP